MKLKPKAPVKVQLKQTALPKSGLVVKLGRLLFGEPGDYLLVPDAGHPMVLSAEEYRANYARQGKANIRKRVRKGTPLSAEDGLLCRLEILQALKPEGNNKFGPMRTASELLKFCSGKAKPANIMAFMLLMHREGLVLRDQAPSNTKARYAYGITHKGRQFLANNG